MVQTFYFYDLETSGFNPREARIMQFAGQRTDAQLKPVGEPHNFLIKMTADVLPDPGAILVTGITPQMTIENGITEAEFLKVFHEQIALAGTLFVGFNNVRFDDEFMRFLNYRNYYDPYEWHWRDERSRWDLLDVVRMTRALRPDGIKWPFDSDGRPANRLGLLTSLNKLEHSNAHDALSDVLATIAVAHLIQKKQPKLFSYLLDYRDKKRVAELVESGKPFIYSSGKYPSEFEKTTAVSMVAKHPSKNGAALVFDLRHNPEEYSSLEPKELVELWQHRCEEWPCPHRKMPVKTLQYNRCPAVAPLSVFDESSQGRLSLTTQIIASNHKKLQVVKTEFAKNLEAAIALLDKAQQTRLIDDSLDVDARLYDGFLSDADKRLMHQVTNSGSEKLADLKPEFKDERLNLLLPLYKARNFPKTLNDSERSSWERFVERKLLSGGVSSRAARYFKMLEDLANNPKLNDNSRYLLEELQLWGQSILPTEV